MRIPSPNFRCLFLVRQNPYREDTIAREISHFQNGNRSWYKFYANQMFSYGGTSTAPVARSLPEATRCGTKLIVFDWLRFHPTLSITQKAIFLFSPATPLILFYTRRSPHLLLCENRTPRILILNLSLFSTLYIESSHQPVLQKNMIFASTARRLLSTPATSQRFYSSTTAMGKKVAVLGAAGGIGQPLSLLLKLSPLVTELSCYDIVGTPGVAADLSHIPSASSVTGNLPAPGTWPPSNNTGLEAALTGASVVVIPAGVPRKPGMTRDDLFNTNAGKDDSLLNNYDVYYIIDYCV
jgi:hypothetical protein